MSGRVSSKIVTDGLVLYLDISNPNSYVSGSTICNDLTYYKNNGMLTNGPTFDSNNGGSIVFDGTNDFIQINNSDSLNPTNTITLCSWVKYNGIYSGYNAPIIFKKNNGLSYFEQYILAFNTSNNVTLALGNGSSNQSIGTPLTYTNQLINIVGIIDTITSSLKIYINGELKVSGSTIYSTMSTSTSPLVIGSYNQPFTGYMGGNIYNVSIYNKSLTESEILQNYNTLKTKYGQ
jgi:hypothetical protein